MSRRRLRQKRISSPALCGSSTRVAIAQSFTREVMDLGPPLGHDCDMNTTKQLIDRYVAIWNQPDADRRRQGIAELWTEDALHVLQPTQEVQKAADTLRVTPTFQVRGHAELEGRVTRAYEEFIADGENTFRAQGEGSRLADAIRFRWEMVTKSGEVAGVGLEFVILAPDGRIRTDYQFLES